MRLIKSLPNSIDIIYKTDKFMSKIEELIQQLCPNGVVYKPLWSVTIWDKKFNSVENKKQSKIINYKYLLAADLFRLQQKQGNVFLLSTGEQTGWTTEELAKDCLKEGEVITIPGGKSRPVIDCIKYYKGKFVTADNRIMTSYDINILNNKFLYYIILSRGEIIDTFYRGSGIKHPDMSKVLDLSIPVPPLPVQEEIVRILDNFTNLKAELQAELQARKSQYEYYRDELLNYNVSKRIPLKNISNGVCSGKSKERIHNGKFPLYGSTGIISSTNTAEYHKEQILIARVGANAGYVYIAKGDYDVSDNTLIVDIKPDFSLKYIFYQLSGMNLHQYAKGGGQPLVTAGQIKEIIIPIPPLAEQDRIVKILDRFDALVNDLSVGLPAEIAARQKQYEYYRDMLLSFNELPNE